MPLTKRPGNRCNDCQHEWAPRGHNLARRCPECKSTNIEIIRPSALALLMGRITGIISLVVLLGLFYGAYRAYVWITSIPNDSITQVEEQSEAGPPADLNPQEPVKINPRQPVSDSVPRNDPISVGSSETEPNPDPVVVADPQFIESLTRSIRPRVDAWREKLGTSKQANLLDGWEARAIDYWAAFKIAYLKRAQAKETDFFILDADLAELANETVDSDGTSILELFTDALALDQGTESAANFARLLFLRQDK